MTRHFGVFQFKADITQEQIYACFEALVDLQNKIPGLQSVEHGPYQSDEGLNDGFTHGFIMTFDSPEARDAYLPHPDHLKVVDLIQPKLERLVVFDFNL
ncbi:Dabb family protein [Verrucomicrobiaceae bacterium N1E253]|uniref:Dabb family protein n=1 Tax=Oceaniferula marina TaxID=2748318 RepID=A0A851GHF2_9BACT|nr:Dabb family protein [Oceaniferula marina]NWK55291.1 Dabb family protein [Oceaniferula marina]